MKHVLILFIYFLHSGEIFITSHQKIINTCSVAKFRYRLVMGILFFADFCSLEKCAKNNIIKMCDFSYIQMRTRHKTIRSRSLPLTQLLDWPFCRRQAVLYDAKVPPFMTHITYVCIHISIFFGGVSTCILIKRCDFIIF